MKVKIPDFDLQKIADSGQCFRMRQLHGHAFFVIAGQRYVTITGLGGDEFEFSCADEEFPFWERYFDLKTDYEVFFNAVDKGDVFLQKAMAYGRGLRILRQDPWEVTVSFIISQRKNLQAIRTAVEALCRCCGEPIETPYGTVYAFPTPQQMAAMPLCDLRGCSVGYRDKYLAALAQRVALGEVSLDAIGELDDAMAKKQLTGLFGIGSKVADCILLFGYKRSDAFPVDVWIGRILSREYNGAFEAQNYRGFAGILQQYMFYYAKSSDYGYKKDDI